MPNRIIPKLEPFEVAANTKDYGIMVLDVPLGSRLKAASVKIDSANYSGTSNAKLMFESYMAGSMDFGNKTLRTDAMSVLAWQGDLPIWNEKCQIKATIINEMSSAMKYYIDALIEVVEQND